MSERLRLLPETLRQIASVADALAAARNQGICTDMIVRLDSTNAEPRGSLRWDDSQHAFLFYPAERNDD